MHFRVLPAVRRPARCKLRSVFYKSNSFDCILFFRHRGCRFGAVFRDASILSATADFAEKGRTDSMFAELDRIVSENNGLWCAEAGKYLLANAKTINWGGYRFRYHWIERHPPRTSYSFFDELIWGGNYIF